MVLSHWSASLSSDLATAFHTLLDEVSGGLEARLFDHPDLDESSGGGNGKLSWQQTLHSSADRHLGLLAEHLAHLHRVTKKNLLSRARLTGIRGRFKVADTIFKDRSLHGKLSGMLLDFNLSHLFPALKKGLDASLDDDDNDRDSVPEEGARGDGSESDEEEEIERVELASSLQKRRRHQETEIPTGDAKRRKY